MVKKIELLKKSYGGESIVDSTRDFSEAFDGEFTPQLKQIPVDEHGFHEGSFEVSVTWRSDHCHSSAPSEEAAYEMGAKGGLAVEAERLAFEAWMRGHCWALCATWDGSHYRSDAEQGGYVDPGAMMTRRLWAAWRDRAALGAM